jgi:dolichol-phosphate mannosyltransferase
MHRSAKSGIGPAYLAGFAHALERGAQRLLEMDADFSHDPRDLHRLLLACDDGADLVLGSRYVPGGGVTDWGLLRRGVSRGGSLYAQMLLRVPVRDLTGGFKCFRREVLEALDLGAIGTDGYGFQIEMTYRALRAGFHVREIPIVFRDRRVGSSKMSARIALEAFWKVPALRVRVR